MANTSITIYPQYYNNQVTAINCGTSFPRLGGTIDISAFLNLQKFTCTNNAITVISGISNLSALREFRCDSNLLTGSIPSLTSNTALTILNCSVNKLTGSIPSLSVNTALTILNCSVNELTGPIPSLSANTGLQQFYCNNNALTGPIPSLSANTELVEFYCFRNGGLNGALPSLSANTKLQRFHCYTCSFTGSPPVLPSSVRQFLCRFNNLDGSIPNFINNTSLNAYDCNNNELVGGIPDLAALTSLNQFICNNNNLSEFSGGVPTNLGNFQAYNNSLTQSAVDAILAAFVAANRSGGTLTLGGTGNAAPTNGQNNSNKLILVGRGWSVTVNG